MGLWPGGGAGGAGVGEGEDAGAAGEGVGGAVGWVGRRGRNGTGRDPWIHRSQALHLIPSLEYSGREGGNLADDLVVVYHG